MHDVEVPLTIELDLGGQFTRQVALEGLRIDGPQLVAATEHHGVAGLALRIVGGHRRIAARPVVDGVETERVLAVNITHSQQID